MSLERIIKTLVTLGLSRLDAEVYVYLANNHPQKAVVLVKALNSTKTKIYVSLRNLRKKGLVTKKGITFFALCFEEALELLIRKEKELSEVLQESENELLANWKNEE
jgi:sugar-specific transcriptional regulator TrmB